MIGAAWFLWNSFNDTISLSMYILYGKKSWAIAFIIVLDELRHGNKAIIKTRMSI